MSKDVKREPKGSFFRSTHTYFLPSPGVWPSARLPGLCVCEVDGEDRGMNEQNVNKIIYEAYLKRGTLTYAELATVLNKENGWSLTAEAVRKRIKRYKIDDDSVDDVFRRLDMQKQAYRDERTAWAKQNREQARTEVNLDLLAEELRSMGGRLFRDIKPPKIRVQKTTMLILLSDWHIGAEFSNAFGEYSYSIAKQRIKTLLGEIWKRQQAEQCEAAYVITVGDLINGAIRRTVQLQNRETVIQQIKSATELLANFSAKLCEIFPSVTLTGVAGNHSRLIENKTDAVKDDRLDTVITWAASLALSHIKNFHYTEPLDTTLATFSIYDHLIYAVHGDYDKFGKTGIQNLITATGKFPYMVLYGHLHSPALMESDGVLLMRGGSLCGVGDDYTIQQRLTGRPAQCLAGLSRDGLRWFQPVFLL